MNTSDLIFMNVDTRQNISMTPMPESLLKQSKRAFTTRHVPESEMATILTGDISPQPGDLVLARVERVRQHARIEQPNGRRNRMFVGDTIIVTYGNRYAPDQFESWVPDSLAACDLVAGGGIASEMRFKSPKVKLPTRIEPIGLIGNSKGQRLNLKDWKVDALSSLAEIPVIFSVGTSMNSGKTTTAAKLIHGLKNDGYKVGAMKITGTGSGGDLWHFMDSGAAVAVDFTDAGHASTYGLEVTEIEQIYLHLKSHVLSHQVDVIVVEIADGILQTETHQLMQADLMKSEASCIYFSAADALSAINGCDWLVEQGYKLNGISGVASSSPLCVHEINNHSNYPVLNKKQFIEPGYGLRLMESLSSRLAKVDSLRMGTGR